MLRLMISLLFIASCDAASPSDPAAVDASAEVDHLDIPVVRLEPAAPTSRDDVVATVEGGGAVEIVWRTGSEDPVIGATLPASRTRRGEVWTVTAQRTAGAGPGAIGEATVTIRNAEPRCLEVSLDDGTGGVTCACTERDEPDDDEPTDTCTFEVDGVVVEGGEGCALPVGAAAGGQEIVCFLVPGDGEAEGPMVTSAGLVLENAPPAGGDVVVSPEAPAEADTVTCAASGAVDPDGDPVQWRYEWLAGEQVIAEGTAAITGNLFDKGQSLRCRAVASDGIAEGAPITSEAVVIVNTAPTLATAQVSPAAASRLDALTCVAEGLGDVDPADAPEVRVAWLVDDEPAGEGVALDATGLAVGAEVRCVATPDDGEDFGPAVTSDPATVVNLAPSIEEAALSPAAPTVLDTLTCDPVGLSDPEDDPVTVTRTWRRNGSTLIGQAGATLSGVFAAGDVIECTLGASDAWDAAAATPAAEVTIGNSPPSVGSVTLTPAAASSCATLTCAASGLSDPDGTEGLTLGWRWTVGGETVPGGEPTLAAPAPGSEVRCFAVATDPSGAASAETGSAPVTIVNAPPTVESAAVVPAEPVVGDVLTCAVQGAVDPDCGASPTPAYAWRLGETVLGSGPSLDTASLAGDDVVTCVATVSDGWDTSPEVTAEVTLSPPPLEAPLVSVKLVEGAVTCVPATPAPEATITWWIGANAPFQGGPSLLPGAATDCDRVRCRMTMPGGDQSNTAELILPLGPACADDNPCTAAACGAQGGCVANPVAGGCDDGEVCTSGDACVAGQCVGQPVTCDDGNPCTEGVCAPGFGCSYGHKAGPCSDGSVCTQSDACDKGACKPGPALACDDGNPCTTDSCDAVAGCVATPNTAACDDGSPCTQDDACAGGTCSGAPVAGSPGCTTGGAPGYCGGGTCHANQPPAAPSVSLSPSAPVTGQALTCTASGGADPDGWPGTITYQYSWRKGGAPIAGQTAATLPGGFVTKGTSITCVVVATDGVSTSAQGSATVAVGNAPPSISGASIQAAGGGPPQPGSGLRCVPTATDPDAGDVLTTTATWWVDDVSTTGTGDTLAAAKVGPCQRVRCQATVSDGAKSAQAQSPEVILPPSAACGASPCQTWSCGPNGGCVGTPRTGACDDGDPCTTGGTCQAGSCVSEPVPADFCDTGNPCADETCQPGAGCVSTPVSGPCDDGTACTTGDTCVAGACTGTPLDCSDGVACTSDACDPDAGCVDVLPPADVTFPITVVELSSPTTPMPDQGPATMIEGTQGGRHVFSSLLLDLPPAVSWSPAKARIEVVAKSPCCNGPKIGGHTTQAQQIHAQPSGDYLASYVLWFLTSPSAQAGDNVCLDIKVSVWNQPQSEYILHSRTRHSVTLTD